MRTLIIAVLLVAVAALPAASSQAAGPDTSFPEQNSGGHSIVIETVDLPEDGFIAIHDASLLQGELFSSVLGVSTRLDAGTHEDLRVYLTRPLAGDNETVIAMPHKDTDDDGIYGFVSSQGAVDGPFVGGADAIPESFFEANAPALAGKGLGDISAVPSRVNVSAYLETSPDQPTSGTSVLIDTVELSAPGYVAIHDATLVESPGAEGINGGNVLTSVIGVSDLLPAGHHHDVLVEVGNNCAGCKAGGSTNGTLIPMAHKETGGNATTYDFVVSGGAQDGPFTGQPGAPLSAVINVVETRFSAEATAAFPEQATGGHIVLFPEVFVPEGGYAAVHDATLLEGNVLGSVIGVSEFLAAGLHRNVSVELSFNGSTGISEDATVIGMLHRETNDNTAYDFVSSEGAQDGPYTGGPDSLAESDLPPSLQGKGLGGVSAIPAELKVSATVRLAAHQTSDGSSVRVEYVDLSEAGFLAFHDASLLANASGNVLSSVVGVSESFTGLQRNLTVQLPGTNCDGCVKGALNTSQLLVAMPHRDSDGDGRYTFITSSGAADGPFVTENGTSNTVNALDLNIVVATGEAIVPVDTGSGQGGGSATGGNATNTTAGSGNTTSGSSTTNGTATSGTAGSVTTTTPVAPTPGTSASPTPDSPEESREAPGAGAALLAVALVAAALIALRRRK